MNETKYKRYALNTNGKINNFYSDAFDLPDGDLIFIEESTDRHYHRQATDDSGISIYKPNSKGDGIIKRTNEELKQDYIDIKKIEIKSKCESVILSKYPEWKQRNVLKRATYLLEKKIDNKITTAEQSEIAELKTVSDWIDNIRDQSNAIELEIESMTLDEIKQFKPEFIE